MMLIADYKIRKVEKMNPCRKCDAKCCKYFALQIDTPKDKDDFENIRWYLTHKDVTVFIEKRKWYLEIKNECRYITPDHSCSIYEKRPLVCREHSSNSCELISDEFDHSHTFNSIEEFDSYLTERFKKEWVT